MTGELPKSELSSPPDRFVSCYVASKKIHAQRLLDLRLAWPKIRFTARWPVVCNLSSEQMRPASHWQADNLSDMLDAEVVLLHADPLDHMQNALFEAGAAWAHGKQIYLAGPHKDYENLLGRACIKRFASLELALQAITQLANYPD